MFFGVAPDAPLDADAEAARVAATDAAFAAVAYVMRGAVAAVGGDRLVHARRRRLGQKP